MSCDAVVLQRIADDKCLLTTERITHETNTSEDWSLILDLCDQVSTQPNAAKEGFKILIKRLNHPNPHVVLHTLTVSDRSGL